MTELGRWGVPAPSPAVATEIEALGASLFGAGEFAHHDAYLRVGEVLATTDSAQVGTAIAYAFSRSPFAHAAALRHLHGRAPGRVFCGLGSATHRMNVDWFSGAGGHALGRMADMVGALRALLAAEDLAPIRYDGPYYHLDARVQAPVRGRSTFRSSSRRSTAGWSAWRSSMPTASWAMASSPTSGGRT